MLRRSLARRRRLGRRRCRRIASLRRQRRQILLARLQRGCLFARRVLKIHSKPNRPDHKSGYAGRDILGDLAALFANELSGFGIVGVDLSPDHRAVGVSVLRLNGRNRLRVAARASRRRHRSNHYPKPTKTHLPASTAGCPSAYFNE